MTCWLLDGSAVPSLGAFLHYMLPSFSLGVLVGAVGTLRHVRRSTALGMKEKDMNERQKHRPIRRSWAWWESFSRRHGTAVQALCVVLVAGCIAGLTWQIHVNSAQDRRRTSDNTTLIACFDQFATDLSGSLPPVRRATAARDTALLAALIGDKGLGGILVRAQMGVKSDPKQDLADLVATFDTLKTAADHLVKVRAANPYPPPPSKFCDLP